MARRQFVVPGPDGPTTEYREVGPRKALLGHGKPVLIVHHVAGRVGNEAGFKTGSKQARLGGDA